MTERVDMFLPASPGTLPDPGTPVPEFEAVAADGQHLDRGAFSGVERIFAVLSTVCGPCEGQVSAFGELEGNLEPRPIITVVGEPADRAAMVARLDGHAVVLEEPEHGPVAEAFEISEFPAVLLVRDGVIQQAGHALSEILPSLTSAAGAPAGSSRRG